MSYAGSLRPASGGEHHLSHFFEITVLLADTSYLPRGPEVYCKENGLTHAQAVYIGDDYGLGGNNEAVYKSGFPYITTDDYRDFPQKVAHLL